MSKRKRKHNHNRSETQVEAAERPLLSLCLIVKNEEAVLARCIQSVREAVDEVIVLDTGSIDRTVDIAEENGACVYRFTWVNDFAAARNAAIDRAKGQWILILDADEALYPGHGKRLREKLEGLARAEAEAFFMQVVNYYGFRDKLLGSTVCSSLRVFRNVPGYRYRGKIHEQIVDPILKANPQAKLVFTDLQIEHDGYLVETVQEKGKSQRNIALLEKELVETVDPAFHRYNIAVEYIRLNDYERALAELAHCKSYPYFRNTSYAHTVLRQEIDCLDAIGRVEEAIEACRKAVDIFQDYTDLHLRLGMLHYRLERWEEAKEGFLAALRIGNPPAHYNTQSGAGTYIPSFHLGKTYEQQRDFPRAIESYLHALHHNPASLPPFLRIVSLLVRTTDARELMDRLQGMFHVQSDKSWWSIALSFYHLGLFEHAAAVLSERETPAEKRQEKEWMLVLCSLLLADREDTALLDETHLKPQEGQEANGLSSRIGFYLALKHNDDRAAQAWLRRLESEGAHAFLLNMYAYIVYGPEIGTFMIPQELIHSASQKVWSELSFMYLLAERDRQPELQRRVRTYWRALISLMPDSKEKIEGQIAFVRVLHVRVHQLILTAPKDDVYSPLWHETTTGLMSLIDDVFLGEIV